MEESFGKKLAEFLSREQFIFNAPMTEHTTFKIGGAADVLIFPSNVQEVAQIFKLIEEFKIPCTILGNGSNVLVLDNGIRGAVIKFSDKFFGNIRCEGTKIIAGAGSNCTETAVMMAKKFESMGADAVLSVVPYYNKPNQRGIEEHFSAIVEAVKLPIILYNIPGRTGVNMLPKTVANLAKKYKNIVAVKQSNGDLDLISEMKQECPDDFVIYSGDDSLTLPMMSIGACGVVSVASHILGVDMKSMIRNFKTGDMKAAFNMHRKLYPAFKKLFMAPNPVPVKAALAHFGIIEDYVRRDKSTRLNSSH